MKLISILEIPEINGGIIGAAPPAIVAFETYAAVFGFPAVIIGAVNVYDDFGAGIGQQVFDATHPDQLGQMIYTKDDFGL
jgi:hypothetical protein